MKKNIVLSSVAAVAVAGMLVLSGCGGNSGSAKKSNTFLPKDGGLSASEKVSLTVGNTKRLSQKDKNGNEKNAVLVTIKTLKGNGCKVDYDENNNCPTEEVAECGSDALTQSGHNCDTTFVRKCADVVGEKLDYAGSSAAGFAALDDRKITADAGKDIRYAGFLEGFTPDDINEGTLYIVADLDCSIGRDSRGVYLNGDTVDAGSRVVAIVEGKDADGKLVRTAVTGTLAYHDTENKTGAFVKFEDNIGIDVSGFHDYKVYFFAEMNDVIVDQSDVWSGATGGSGASGS